MGEDRVSCASPAVARDVGQCCWLALAVLSSCRSLCHVHSALLCAICICLSPPPLAAAAAQVPKGLEMAVCQMNAGQQSLIRCCSDYGFSSTRRPPSVPIDAPLFFLVRVLRWEKEKNLHEMSLTDKFDYCDRRRQCGKDLFAGSKPLSAARQYDKAITALESIRNHEVEMKTAQHKNFLVTLFLVNQAQSEQTKQQATVARQHAIRMRQSC